VTKLAKIAGGLAGALVFAIFLIGVEANLGIAASIGVIVIACIVYAIYKS
jgi:hypothetical protein